MIATSVWEWLLLGGPWQLMIGVPLVLFVLSLIVAGVQTVFGALFGNDE